MIPEWPGRGTYGNTITAIEIGLRMGVRMGQRITIKLAFNTPRNRVARADSGTKV